MEQEINVYTSLHPLISQRWKRMLLFATGLTLVVAGILFSLPRYYSATIQVIPESSEGGVSLPKNIAELSSLAGFSMNANNGKDAINPDIYPDIFNSNNFIIDVLKLQVIRQTKDTMSYYNYLTFHQEQPWWDRALEVIKGNKTPPSRTIDFTATHFNLHQEQLIKETKSNIRCDIDKKTGMISLTTMAQDPYVSSSLANAIMKRLQAYIIDYRTSKARIDLRYAERLQKEARERYAKVQKAYVAYSDSHTDLVLNEYKTKEADLENEMQQAFNALTQLGVQVETAKAKLQERTPAFTVIQEAPVPVRPAGPKRMIPIFLTFILGIVSSGCYYAFRGIR